jgi:branched-chain amino acid transport system substrate-binding protein
MHLVPSRPRRGVVLENRAGLTRRTLGKGASAALFALASGAARAAIPTEGVKIGVLTDMTGPYADLSGAGSVAAAQLAVAEFGGTINGKPITVVSANHQNKPDIAASIAREWFDVGGVDMVIDFPNSATALAVQEIARQKKKIAIYTITGTTELTGKSCSPYGFHWMYDTYSNSVGLVNALAERGLKTYYFITVDYAFGHAMENDFRSALAKAGMQVVGATTFPLGTSDFSSSILAAQGSKAQAVVLASAGQDNINAVKAAREFGLQQSGQTLVIPAAMITDIKSMGLEAAQGAVFVDAFYWNMDERARAFGLKYFAKMNKMPTVGQAGVYSGTRHFLQAVKDTDSVDADVVADKMRATVVDDAVVRDGHIREDGRLVKEMYVAQVKSPAASKEDWDLERIIATIPGDKAFRPLSQSECPLVKKASLAVEQGGHA